MIFILGKETEYMLADNCTRCTFTQGLVGLWFDEDTIR